MLVAADSIWRKNNILDDGNADVTGLAADIATIVHTSGQESEETIQLVARLGASLGQTMSVIPQWGFLLLRNSSAVDNFHPHILPATPDAVVIDRVAATSQVAEALIEGRVDPETAREELAKARNLPVSPDHFFALACAMGAAALSVTFGISHFFSVILTVFSAGTGAYLRRFIARTGGNGLVQSFCAALLAGVIGAVATRLNLSSELRLIAVCPCMVLVPGPFLLNGTLDLLGNRMPLGIARLSFAGMILLAISAGLLTGLFLCGVTLPPMPAGREVALWITALAGGVAAACYSIFFSMPLRLLGWPVITAIAADTARWIAMALFGAGPVIGASVAGFVASILLMPVARRHHIPFAGIGFASVVSLMPGVFVFRMFAGLLALQHASSADMTTLLEGTLTDGLTAFLVVAAMTVAIVVPKHTYDAYRARHIAR
ncbi:putative membrane spanning protein [Granulibacter bethesdensis]|nr:putative membrane spanning protein [Granulibacter bethesdensis]